MKRRKRFNALRSTLVILAFVCPLVAHADLFNQVAVTPAFSGFGGPCGTAFVVAVGPSDQSCSTTGGFDSAGSGTTQIDYGYIHVDNSSLGAMASVARGRIEDSVTFNIPGVANGTPGTFTYELDVSGELLAISDLGSANWLLQTVVGSGGSGFDLTESGALETASGGNPGFTGSPYGAFLATGHFQSGIAGSLDLEFSGTTGASYTTVSKGDAMEDSTMSWGGISDVMVGGNPVASFTVTSASGTNWAAPFVSSPVPEPSYIWLLAGSGILMLHGRRRRS